MTGSSRKEQFALLTLGLEWPEAELGPLCPGVWVEEADLESLPGMNDYAGETWWLDPRDKGDELVLHLAGEEARDARLSLDMTRARRARCEEARVQWATDKVASLFLRARTRRDLDKAFAFMSQVRDRGFVADGIIALAKARVARNEAKAREASQTGLQELNRAMSEWARGISYRVRLDDEQEPVTQQVRDQEWALVELRPGIGQVCRGRSVGEKPVLMREPEIFGFMQSQTA